jgi:hypothetical protein
MDIKTKNAMKMLASRSPQPIKETFFPEHKILYPSRFPLSASITSNENFFSCSSLSLGLVIHEPERERAQKAVNFDRETLKNEEVFFSGS